jgi:hypothetical protein
MLRNELELCKRIISGSVEIIKFHLYALGTGREIKKKNASYRDVACRRIRVYRNKGKISFEYIPGPYLNENVVPLSYSLMYKKCPSDSSKSRHYYFGDIRIAVKNKVLSWTKEVFSKSVSSPVSPNCTLPPVIPEFFKAFWDNFDEFWSFVEQEHARILKDPQPDRLYVPESGDISKTYMNMFFHFDMTDLIGCEQWYSKEGFLEALDKNELDIVKDETFEFHKEINQYSLRKKLIHMIGSGDPKNDNQFVGFDIEQRYKSFSLEEERLRDLFYYTKIIRACNISIPWSKPYFFRLIPVGDFNGQDALDFFKALGNITGESDIAEGIEEGEEQLKVQGYDFTDPSSLLSDVTEEHSKGGKVAGTITSFDLILVRNDKVDTNLGEINNLARSALRRTTKNIMKKIEEVQAARRTKQKLSVVGSFYDLHQSISKGEKYQAKLVQMMMKLYRDSYYGDLDIDRIFTEQALRDIRAEGFTRYYGQRTSYELLKQLAKEKKMDVSKEGDGKSKELGKLFARVIWPLGLAINSFDKAQIGNIASRITGVAPIRCISTMIGKYQLQLTQHQGAKIGKGVVKLDPISFHEASNLIDEFQATGLKFAKHAFIVGLLDEYQYKKYIATKPD